MQLECLFEMDSSSYVDTRFEIEKNGVIVALREVIDIFGSCNWLLGRGHLLQGEDMGGDGVRLGWGSCQSVRLGWGGDDMGVNGPGSKESMCVLRKGSCTLGCEDCI